MINSHKIIESICEKIKFVAGDEIILEQDFEEQLSAIKSNFNDAKKKALEKVKQDNLIRYLTDFEYTDWELFKDSNKIFKNYFQRTNSFLENKLWSDERYYPLLMREILISDAEVRKKFIVKYINVLATLKNAQKGLDSEDLSKVKNYYVNIVHDNWMRNTEKSIPTLSDRLFSDVNLNRFYLLIYLLTNDRIIKLKVDFEYITSEEHIIQKDLKKVTNTNSNVEFHYHGLHDPDCLAMDTYDEAVKLRILMSELRENRKITR